MKYKAIGMRRTASYLLTISLLLAGFAFCVVAGAKADDEVQPVKIAVLDFELVDTSLEGASHGVDEVETQRLVLISKLLRELLAKSGEYAIVDPALAETQIASAGLIHGCNGCDISIARALDADHVMTGTVQKVSTLILGVEITEREVATGKTLRVVNAQIRGNTDKSWSRGVRWLVRNRLLAAR
ncbi:MAG: DUF3280 domain-containing protein [Hyphomicrobiales bacterium]|nr:DUF3280 domain-containing protein [Hyphomicrobiales bacterium]